MQSPGAGEIRGESLDGAGVHRRHPVKQSRYHSNRSFEPCVPHQAIIKAGLISKTKDLERQKLLTTFSFLMFYPIKRLLHVKQRC